MPEVIEELKAIERCARSRGTPACDAIAARLAAVLAKLVNRKDADGGKTRPTGEDAMSSEHVEVLERLRGVLEHGKMGDKCLIAPDLVTAAIAALSAPQPPAEAQAQGGWDLKEVVCLACGDHIMPMGQVCHACSHPVSAPPSAPVGVDGLPERWRREAPLAKMDSGEDAARAYREAVYWCAFQLEAALAQQPAAVECDCPAGRIDHASWCAVSKAQDAALAAQQGGSDNDR